MRILGKEINFQMPSARVTGPIVLCVALGACATGGGPDLDADLNLGGAGADDAIAAGSSHGEACMEGGDFSVLAGLFAGSSSRYNEDCGFQRAITAIFYNENSTEEEKAVALRALANRYPGVEKRLNEVAQAYLEGRNPLFPALDADDTITCRVGPQTGGTDSTATFRIENCGPTARPS